MGRVPTAFGIEFVLKPAAGHHQLLVTRAGNRLRLRRALRLEPAARLARPPLPPVHASDDPLSIKHVPRLSATRLVVLPLAAVFLVGRLANRWPVLSSFTGRRPCPPAPRGRTDRRLVAWRGVRTPAALPRSATARAAHHRGSHDAPRLRPHRLPSPRPGSPARFAQTRACGPCSRSPPAIDRDHPRLDQPRLIAQLQRLTEQVRQRRLAPDHEPRDRRVIGHHIPRDHANTRRPGDSDTRLRARTDAWWLDATVLNVVHRVVQEAVRRRVRERRSAPDRRRGERAHWRAWAVR